MICTFTLDAALPFSIELLVEFFLKSCAKVGIKIVTLDVTDADGTIRRYT